MAASLVGDGLAAQSRPACESRSDHYAHSWSDVGRWPGRRHRRQHHRLRAASPHQRARHSATGPKRDNTDSEHPPATACNDRFHQRRWHTGVPGQPAEDQNDLRRSRCGTVGGVIGLVNEGNRPCHLAGWPAVVAVSPAGNARAERTLNVFGATTLTAPPVVTIKPGAQAVAVLVAHDQPAPGQAKCPPPYRRLLITPPGSTHATAVSARIPNFTYLPACTPIQVSPVVPVPTVPYLRLHHA